MIMVMRKSWSAQIDHFVVPAYGNLPRTKHCWYQQMVITVNNFNKMDSTREHNSVFSLNNHNWLDRLRIIWNDIFYFLLPPMDMDKTGCCGEFLILFIANVICLNQITMLTNVSLWQVTFCKSIDSFDFVT